MMLLLVVVAGVLLSGGLAEAITWDFDDGTTQGWAAKEAVTWGGLSESNLFPGVVEDGVWQVDVLPSVAGDAHPASSVEVISSTIGYDSSLFDRVRVRFRTVHHSPTLGYFTLQWTNEHNFVSPGGIESRFTLPGGQPNFVYTTEWQEVEFSLVGQDEIVWEGLLRDIRLSFGLDSIDITLPPRPVSDVVGVFEIDWIELTGVEELLQGELAPPYVGYFRFEGPKHFAPPIFYPITQGIGNPIDIWSRSGVLTDLEGDGDLDLFAVYDYWTEGEAPSSGWVMALNDGRGALKTVRVKEVVSTMAVGPDETPESVSLRVAVGDLTGDGQDEVVLSRSSETATAVWSVGPELQIEVLTEIPDRRLRDMADWDGDGVLELFVGKSTTAGSTLEVWDVEHGVWTSSEVAVSKNYVATQIGDFTGDGVLEVLWLPLAGKVDTRLVTGLGTDLQGGEFIEFEEYKPVLRMGDMEFEVENPVVDTFFGSFEINLAGPVLRAGDFDGDGQVDLLTAFIRILNEGVKGLAVQRRGAGGGVETEVLYDDRLWLRSSVVVRDLDADGVNDWVFIGGDRASGFGVFVEWGGGLNPAKEVERHRLVGNGSEVLPGDVDGDGDLDLVVLSRLSEGGYTADGVYVLKSLVSDQITAVQTPEAARPVQHRLGNSYPNPFNPAVVIPLDLATDAVRVSLTVYDVLGRRVRQMWQGPLGAGTHRFTWDGRDEVGKGVAAGVYIYKVEVDGRVEAKKTTKLP